MANMTERKSTLRGHEFDAPDRGLLRCNALTARLVVVARLVQVVALEPQHVQLLFQVCG